MVIGGIDDVLGLGVILWDMGSGRRQRGQGVSVTGTERGGEDMIAGAGERGGGGEGERGGGEGGGGGTRQPHLTLGKRQNEALDRRRKYHRMVQVSMLMVCSDGMQVEGREEAGRGSG